jgi:hypothetical protein
MTVSMRPVVSGVLLSLLALPIGCKRPSDQTGNFKTAIDTYYAQWPECLWPEPIQMPQQHGISDTDKVRPFDALVDQGLLSRTPVEKTKLLVFKENANSYDLTDKGRSNWTIDNTRPGYGNFCYAHRKVQDIQSFTPAGTQPGATTRVNYTWTLGDVKDWAAADETQNAFPRLKGALIATNNAQTTLVLTNNGWKVQDAAPHSTNPDANVVQ